MALFSPPATCCPFEFPLSAEALHIAHCAEAEMLISTSKTTVKNKRVFIMIKVRILTRIDGVRITNLHEKLRIEYLLPGISLSQIRRHS